MFVLVFCGVAFLLAGIANELVLGDVRRLFDVQYLQERRRHTPLKAQRIVLGRVAMALGLGCLLIGGLAALR